MAKHIFTKGQALSTWGWAIAGADTQVIFEGNNDGVRAIRVQGFTYDGTITVQVKDAQGAIIFDRGHSFPGIYAPNASGSYGMICTAPLTCVTAAGTGGKLVVYGEVL